jgi:predicted SPOUT superfamily RNA methylase MTH1
VVPKTGFQIVSSYEKTEITMSVRGLTTAYLGFTVDNGKKEEKLLKNGDELNVTAQENLRLSIANAKGIELKINNVPVTIGESGQIVAKVVRWYRDEEKNDLFHLVIDDWEK